MTEASRANYRTATDIMSVWTENVLSGSPPRLYPIGEGELAQIRIGPNLVTLIGGAPGAGKTAFVMQAMIDALRMTPDLSVCVCNVEMTSEVLLERQLSRLSGVNLNLISNRETDRRHRERIEAGLETLRSLGDRLCFVEAPYHLENVARTADVFGADIIVLDYLQRIRLSRNHTDRRASIDALMDKLRQFADAGMSIIAVAAVSRSKDSRGRSTYGSGLNLASFRESSEIEFGADDAYILVPNDNPEEDNVVTLRHLKARHSEPRHIEMIFNRSVQHFQPRNLSQRPVAIRLPTPRPRRRVDAEVDSQ